MGQYYHICSVFNKPKFPLFLQLTDRKLILFGQVENIALCLKKYHKKERHLCLPANIFTKLSQNVYSISTRILIYWCFRCNSKFWKDHWFNCVFKVISYIIDDHSFLNYFISTKLSQIVYLINVHILVCQHIKCDCRL